MQSRRTWALQWGASLAVAGFGSGWVRAASPERVSISVPGPGNLLFLPITLASKLGADRAEGLELDIRYVGGGPIAFRDMLERNTDFSAGGLAALALQRISGKPVQCVAPLTRVPAYTLLVRADLRQRVKTVADLSGRVIGVKGQAPGGRSTTQLFTEFVLAQSGVAVQRVNYVPVGQSYDSQHAALGSGTVDAIMGDEPFATRMVRDKVAYALADYHELRTTRTLLGGLFLNGHIATRDDVVSQRPDLVGRVVASIRRTLVWMEQHSAAEMIATLALDDAAERAALLEVLKLRKDIYSPDGRISSEQVASVQRFLRATELSPDSQRFELASMVNARWAGSAA